MNMLICPKNKSIKSETREWDVGNKGGTLPSDPPSSLRKDRIIYFFAESFSPASIYPESKKIFLENFFIPLYEHHLVPVNAPYLRK